MRIMLMDSLIVFAKTLGVVIFVNAIGLILCQPIVKGLKDQQGEIPDE